MKLPDPKTDKLRTTLITSSSKRREKRLNMNSGLWKQLPRQGMRPKKDNFKVRKEILDCSEISTRGKIKLSMIKF